MMILSDNQKQAILATFRNGMGLTVAAKGLQIPIDELSTYLRTDKAFFSECKTQIANGFQYMLSNINTAAAKKHWNNWNYSKTQLQQSFIFNVTLWESFSTKEQWSPAKFMQALKICKTLDETATAMGHTEAEMIERIYSDTNIQLFLMENNVPF